MTFTSGRSEPCMLPNTPPISFDQSDHRQSQSHPRTSPPSHIPIAATSTSPIRRRPSKLSRLASASKRALDSGRRRVASKSMPAAERGHSPSKMERTSSDTDKIDPTTSYLTLDEAEMPLLPPSGSPPLTAHTSSSRRFAPRNSSLRPHPRFSQSSHQRFFTDPTLQPYMPLADEPNLAPYTGSNLQSRVPRGGIGLPQQQQQPARCLTPIRATTPQQDTLRSQSPVQALNVDEFAPARLARRRNNATLPSHQPRERSRLSIASSENQAPLSSPDASFAYWCGRYSSVSDRLRNEDLARMGQHVPDGYFCDDAGWVRQVMEGLGDRVDSQTGEGAAFAAFEKAWRQRVGAWDVEEARGGDDSDSEDEVATVSRKTSLLRKLRTLRRSAV